MDEPTIEWTRELSPFDHLMYRMDADSRSRTSLLTVDILDEVPNWERLCTDLERASRVALRLRQRVVAPIVPLTPAQWVVDPDFDLRYHVRRIALPAPGSERQLLDLAQTLHATPLDQGRPLWEATLVEGLDEAIGGKAALIWKMSHAVTDGVGGMALERMTRSEERDPDWGPMPPLPGSRGPLRPRPDPKGHPRVAGLGRTGGGPAGGRRRWRRRSGGVGPGGRGARHLWVRGLGAEDGRAGPGRAFTPAPGSEPQPEVREPRRRAG